MPTYELAILYKVLPKDKLTEALKTTANLIFQEGGIIRKLHNLGSNPTPYRITKGGHSAKVASYFIYEFDYPTSAVNQLGIELRKYDYVLRSNIFQPVTPIISSDCKIDEETQIAPFRKEVQDMIKRAKKLQLEKEIAKVKPNTNLPFDPFPL